MKSWDFLIWIWLTHWGRMNIYGRELQTRLRLTSPIRRDDDLHRPACWNWAIERKLSRYPGRESASPSDAHLTFKGLIKRLLSISFPGSFPLTNFKRKALGLRSNKRGTRNRLSFLRVKSDPYLSGKCQSSFSKTHNLKFALLNLNLAWFPGLSYITLLTCIWYGF